MFGICSLLMKKILESQKNDSDLNFFVAKFSSGCKFKAHSSVVGQFIGRVIPSGVEL